MTDSTPTIVIHGPSVRWAAESLRRSGHRVVGIDCFGDSDTLAACDEFHLANESGELASLATKAAAKWHSPPVRVGGDRSADGWAAPQSQRIAELASGADIPVPESRDAPPVDAGRRWLRKRRGSTGGLGVQRHIVARRIDLSRDSDANDSDANEFVWQREIAGRPYGLVALATGTDVELLGLCRGMNTVLRRSPSRQCHPFVYAGSIGPCHPPSRPWKRWQDFATQAADALGLRGLFNIDFVRDGEGRFWFLEINPRPSGSCEVLEHAFIRQGILAANDSLMRWHLAALNGEPTPITTVRHLASGNAMTCKRIVYANRDGRWDPTGLPVGKPVEDCGVRVRIADVGVRGTVIGRGEPIATMLIDACSADGADEIAKLRRTCRRWIRQVRAAVKSMP